ncbi:helix-turn-helix domain-containing protein [Alicyclobacillus mali]|uniref:Helix-turn-helix domain-containing protein n=1 Tax=Alicyclobacillus mali (ex Roth et al. 2021) TaxID=1123961 RepID=A0ABS0F6K4_9BACL|nr:helix-turn-helix domain-containing protein [Alicyclobacillus mali (ex Roth et al. 2021)]MBF8378936.1 helix-turn-helix domain-containing protein [Alicyclobacillus mali (ex Roth et al. 2021)]MCL6487327.1 helix-turn-helix domain-containing protein [Alicyclobacillus mali (ex Roth et al. 2021)]
MGQLEETVKSLLKLRSMSMRQLAAVTGISVSTISKMIAGKQRVNVDYLRRIADALGVSPITLAEAAGLPMTPEPLAIPEGEARQTAMNTFFEYLGLAHWDVLREEIERELEKYEAYAQTDEGRQLIAEKYHVKRGQIQGIGDFLRDLDDIYDLFSHPETPEDERRILASGILYFLLATDAIPDYLFPAGYLDDAIAMQMVRERLERRRKEREDPGTAGDAAF